MVSMARSERTREDGRRSFVERRRHRSPFDNAGTPVLKYAANKSIEEKELLATHGARTVLKMVLHHNFVHGDLHPGNVLVEESTGGWLSWMLVFVWRYLPRRTKRWSAF